MAFVQADGPGLVLDSGFTELPARLLGIRRTRWKVGDEAVTFEPLAHIRQALHVWNKQVGGNFPATCVLIEASMTAAMEGLLVAVLAKLMLGLIHSVAPLINCGL